MASVDFSDSRKLKLRLEFSGAGFCGWQVQADEIEAEKSSVQGALERALKIYLRTKDRIAIQGGGRTDAGVHAREYFCHFTIPNNVEFLFSNESIEKLHRSLNGLLPDGVSVTHVERCDEFFHALNDIRWKTYEYSILVRTMKPALNAGSVWWVPQTWKSFNTQSFMRAMSLFEGEHDFRAFAASDHDAKTTVRKIFEMRCVVEPWGFSCVQNAGVLLRIRLTGEGFLKQMVRNIVGSLVEVGQEKKTLPELYTLLSEGRDRKEAGFCAPAQGLSLVQVSYNPWGEP